jgi:hypothetical protein
MGKVRLVSEDLTKNANFRLEEKLREFIFLRISGV